jgi:hypothetical protein
MEKRVSLLRLEISSLVYSSTKNCLLLLGRLECNVLIL